MPDFVARLAQIRPLTELYVVIETLELVRSESPTLVSSVDLFLVDQA